MTGLLRLSFAQTGNSGKTEHWRMESPLRQNRDVCSLLVENAVSLSSRRSPPLV